LLGQQGERARCLLATDHGHAPHEVILNLPSRQAPAGGRHSFLDLRGGFGRDPPHDTAAHRADRHEEDAGHETDRPSERTAAKRVRNTQQSPPGGSLAGALRRTVHETEFRWEAAGGQGHPCQAQPDGFCGRWRKQAGRRRGRLGTTKVTGRRDEKEGAHQSVSEPGHQTKYDT